MDDRQGRDARTKHYDEDDDVAQPTALLHDLSLLTGKPCTACSHRLCGHEALFSIFMGLKDAPRCLNCLAATLHRPAAELRDEIADYFQYRDCYRQAWDAASRPEGFGGSRHPGCLWPTGAAVAGRPTQTRPLLSQEQPIAHRPVDFWDAGDMGCGELVMALRGRLLKLAPGDVLELTARDPAAPQDLPAWCRLTGHRLVQASHPQYFIQRKEA